MKAGTPGFVGARLVEVREALGLSASSLAHIVQVTKQSISTYENGKSSPVPETFARLCERLAMPPQYFLRPVPVRKASPAFYRCNAATTKGARLRAFRLTSWLQEMTEHLSESVEMPPVDLPMSAMPDNPFEIDGDDIDCLANEVRAAWRLGDGPISNVVWLMEHHGIVVARTPLESAKLDGLSCWLDERPYVLLNADVTAARARFDAAHELGHILLHRRVETRHLNDKALFNMIETQAHRFAAAFLFPATAFAREAQPITLDRFAALKERWRLSVKMMIFRAHDLRLIDDDQRTSLYRSYGWRKWSRREPLDDELPVERPCLVSKGIEALLDGGVQSAEEILHGAPFGTATVARLSGVPEVRFSGAVATVYEIQEIQPRLRGIDPDVPRTPGVLVQFPMRPRDR